MARKHFTQMTSEEKGYLSRKIDTAMLRYSKHNNIRMEDREIEKEDIQETLKSFEIINFRMESLTSQSVTIRSRKKIEGNYIHLVIGIPDGKIITCYKHPYPDDKADLSIYNDKLDIRNLVKSNTKLRTGYFKNTKRKKRNNNYNQTLTNN